MRNLKFFFRFQAAFTKPENMAGVPFADFLYDAPYFAGIQLPLYPNGKGSDMSNEIEGAIDIDFL